MDSRTDHIFPSLNWIVAFPVDEVDNTTLPAMTQEKGNGERVWSALHKWPYFSSILVTLSLPHSLPYGVYFSGQWEIVPVEAKRLLISTVQLPSQRDQITCIHSQCEANKVKWSQQIMQRGHEVNCQWETGFMCPAVSKYHAGWLQQL